MSCGVLLCTYQIKEALLKTNRATVGELIESTQETHRGLKHNHVVYSLFDFGKLMA